MNTQNLSLPNYFTVLLLSVLLRFFMAYIYIHIHTHIYIKLEMPYDGVFL